jgi:hypothetical protein
VNLIDKVLRRSEPLCKKPIIVYKRKVGTVETAFYKFLHSPVKSGIFLEMMVIKLGNMPCSWR